MEAPVTESRVSAGGIVYRRMGGEVKVVLVRVRRATSERWVLPKGLVDPGESLDEAARGTRGDGPGGRCRERLCARQVLVLLAPGATPSAGAQDGALLPDATPLIPLSQSRHRPENPALDVRGYLMLGSDGQVMGRVEDILLEADQRTEDRGAPLYHMEYAVVRYQDAEGLEQRILVPMAVVKETHPQERKVVVRGPAREACQEAFNFRAPDSLKREDEEEIYSFWDVLPRWQRSARAPDTLFNRRR